MLTFFHYGLLVGLGIILIAIMKADHATRIIIVAGVVAVILFVKFSQKKR